MKDVINKKTVNHADSGPENRAGTGDNAEAGCHDEPKDSERQRVDLRNFAHKSTVLLGCRDRVFAAILVEPLAKLRSISRFPEFDQIAHRDLFCQNALTYASAIPEISRNSA
jgi:hypothetical protein